MFCQLHQWSWCLTTALCLVFILSMLAMHHWAVQRSCATLLAVQPKLLSQFLHKQKSLLYKDLMLPHKWAMWGNVSKVFPLHAQKCLYIIAMWLLISSWETCFTIGLMSLNMLVFTPQYHCACCTHSYLILLLSNRGLETKVSFTLIKTFYWQINYV